jgi:nucleoid-associated protein YgaU
MPTIITRLYAAEEHALGAVNALKQKFEDHEISLVTSKSGKDIEGLVAKAGVKKPQAAAFVDGVRKGGAVVTVRAAWGFAQDANKRLDAYKPIKAAEHHVGTDGWHDPAPLSALLHLPAIENFKSDIDLPEGASPLSDLLKLPTLSNLKPNATLLNQAAPYSDLAKWPTVADLKPFSSLMETKSRVVLAANCPSPLSDLFFLPVIVRDWRS